MQSEKRLKTSSRCLLFFIILSLFYLSANEKDFLIILFQNILLSKEFLVCIGCLKLFIKTKKGSGTCFWCAYSAYFFHKNGPYVMLDKMTKFQYQTYFPSQDVKQYMFLNSCIANWWCIINLRFIFDHPLEQWLTGGEGKRELIFFEQLANEKSFLDEIKNRFSNFLRAIIWWKKSKIVGSSFKP